MDLRLAVLKFSWFLAYIVLNFFLSCLDFLKFFHNTVMIYNTRNQSNYTTEIQKERKPVLMSMQDLNVQCMLTNFKGVYSWNKMWSIKSLVMLKRESSTSLHAAQYKWQTVRCFVLIIWEMANLDTLFLYFVYSKPGFVLRLFLNVLPKPRLLFLNKIALIKKE